MVLNLQEKRSRNELSFFKAFSKAKVDAGDTGQPLEEPLRGHEDEVKAVAFSPDGSKFVSGSEDNTIRLWDVGTSQLLGEPLRGHEDEVTAVSFSPDGSRTVSAVGRATSRS
ncbi:hypothetical protein PIIN_11885 [Serendipita indica DSM 11827]|uniref:Uncharacterized protein n=1 Tax=Serendipita indica (strain DSM 11827) TaxID=1109443 RepID=G4TUW4_SERID|nr:hypothetical protein PIIN_11885 [Serendipita indica DSM 11827]